MSLEQISLLEQLARILARLETEFRDLREDVEAPDDQQASSLELVAEKIDFAAHCIGAAKRALADDRAHALADPAPDAAPPSP